MKTFTPPPSPKFIRDPQHAHEVHPSPLGALRVLRGSSSQSRRFPAPNPSSGSVLILVLWISFGLVVLSLYFAQSMTFELRAADNRVAALEADHAIDGAARYVATLLANNPTNGAMPDPLYTLADAVPVGDALFWLLARQTNDLRPDYPVFGLIDEGSKLNLNTATTEMLEALPNMTANLAAAIVDWRDEDADPQPNGAEDETYQRLQPPRRCKNAPFETVDELRLVYGAELELLYGEDLNRNGILDPNENDGDISPPNDNRDGRLQGGILEYLTVHSSQPNTRSDGSRRININTAQGRQQLNPLLVEKFGQERAQAILGALGPNPNLRSVLEFAARANLTDEELAQIQTDIGTSNAASLPGLININSASETVLACIPGIEPDKAATLAAFRTANPDRLGSLAWVNDILDEADAAQAGPFLTAQTYQVTADIAAVGHLGRGYRRIKYTFDLTQDPPRIVLRQDLTAAGWALGPLIREDLTLANLNPR